MSATVTSTAILLILSAYLLGSISCAVLACRLYALPDPRLSGSHNPGTTNVFRHRHRPAAVLTLCGDLLKGLLPVVLARQLEQSTLVVSLTALAAVLGHLWPLFFRFQGGKGVATTLGCCLGISTQLGLALVTLWLLPALWFRIASLAALTLALGAIPLTLWLTPDYAPLLGALAILLLLRHRDNMLKLRRGQEHKL